MKTNIFAKTCELGTALGLSNIKGLPGCWEHQVDSQWWLAFNAHSFTVACSHGGDVPAFTVYFEYNGWPAGISNAQCEMLCAGEIANEYTLIAALDAAIAAATESKRGN